MTATRESLSWLAELDGRCPRCFLHVPSMGHRDTLDDLTTVTGCTPSGPVGLELGRHLAAVGMARTVEAHPDDAALVDAVLERRIRRGGEFSLNDLRPELVSVANKAVIGARVQAFARSKRIRRVGYVPSTDSATHGHPVAQWRAVA